MSPYLIPDDPIVRCMEQTGRPPWEVHAIKVWSPFRDDAEIYDGWDEDEDFWQEGDDGSVYFGNETKDF